MLDAGAEVLETDTFQASRLKLSEWGLERAHVRDQPEGGRDRAQGRRRATASSPARSARPASCRPATTRRSARSSSRSWSTVFEEQAHALIKGGADLIIIETAQDILEVKAADLRRARGVQAGRPQRADPVQRVAAAPGRQDAARHRHQRGAGHARGARRRRDRAQLLDRPRGHARRDPLPRRELPGPGPLHPERRPAAPGPERRDDLPRGARAARERARRVRRALRRDDRRRLLRHDARPHRRDRRARARDASRASARRAGRRTCRA